MLKQGLGYIRQQPKHVRDQYALAIALICTGSIVALWLFGFTRPAIEVATSVEPETAATLPASTITAPQQSIGQLMRSVQEELGTENVTGDEDVSAPVQTDQGLEQPVSIRIATVTSPVSE